MAELVCGLAETDLPRYSPTGKENSMIPKSKQSLQPVERLLKLGQKRDRSLVVEAILEYLKREKGK